MIPKNLCQLLLAIVAFSASWGEGMQHVLPNPTYIFIVSVFLLLLINWRYFFSKNCDFYKVPKFYKYFLVFVLFHTIIYCLLNPEVLAIGREEQQSLNEDFVIKESSSGEVIFRYLYFAFFSFLLSFLLRKNNNLLIFSIFYNIGFSLTILSGGYSAEYSGLFRLSGGMADPNAMAMDAILAFFLSLFAFKKGNIITKIILTICGIISLFALFMSFSRGAILSMIICLLIISLHHIRLYKIATWGVMLFLGVIILFHSLPSDMKDIVAIRFSIEETSGSGGAGRTEIWNEYLKYWPTYFVMGTGMANCQSVLTNNKSSEKRVTHNQYLLVLVEYGIIGLMLYLMFFMYSWKFCFSCIGTSYQFLIMPFISMSIITVFLNIDNGRSFWIIIAIFNYVWYHKRYIMTNKALYNTSCKIC